MTTKEKALELLWKYDHVAGDDDKGTTCALVAVDEILKVASFYNDSQAEVTYWNEVKQEIEKI